jgi:hypothetical protein
MSDKNKVLNAFEIYDAEKKIDQICVNPPKKRTQTLRDTSITKICALCGKNYHPTRNGFADISKYCSQKCTHQSVSKKFY